MLDIGKPGSGDWSQIADKRGQAKLEQGSANKQTNKQTQAKVEPCFFAGVCKDSRAEDWQGENHLI